MVNADDIKLIIENYMPKKLQDILFSVYRKVNNKVILDRKLFCALKEYFELNNEEVKCFLKIGKTLYLQLWDIISPKTEQEKLEFYKKNPYNIFKLANWHMKFYQRRFRKKIIRESYGDVLDYGGGIGDLSIALAEKGLDVVYAEVPGRTMEFAKFLFKRRNKRIKVVEIVDDFQKNLRMFDTIICIDVIEHVNNPRSLLKMFSNYLKNSGKLIITNLDIKEREERPDHKKLDFDAEALLEKLGFEKVKGWLWKKRVRRNKKLLAYPHDSSDS